MATTLFLIAIVLVGAYVAGLFYQYEIVTQKTIAAKKQVVWGHLVSFESYEDWNPFITTIKGQATKGDNLKVFVSPPDGKTMAFKPKLVLVDENKELRWRGTLIIPGIFDGEHYFKISTNKDGATELIHGENFCGLLAWLIIPSIVDSTTAGFANMNAALAERSKNIDIRSKSPKEPKL